MLFMVIERFRDNDIHLASRALTGRTLPNLKRLVRETQTVTVKANTETELETGSLNGVRYFRRFASVFRHLAGSPYEY